MTPTLVTANPGPLAVTGSDFPQLLRGGAETWSMRILLARVAVVSLCVLAVSAPVAVSGAATAKAKINCKKIDAAFSDLSLQYQKLLFLDSADQWASTARDPLGGTLDGAALRADAKALAPLRSVKTTSLGFPSMKSVLANAKHLGDLVDAALASTAPFPGPGQDAFELATRRSTGDRSALGYATDHAGCRATGR
jgi:hypothetical protein